MVCDHLCTTLGFGTGGRVNAEFRAFEIMISQKRKQVNFLCLNGNGIDSYKRLRSRYFNDIVFGS